MFAVSLLVAYWTSLWFGQIVTSFVVRLCRRLFVHSYRDFLHSFEGRMPKRRDSHNMDPLYLADYGTGAKHIAPVVGFVERLTVTTLLIVVEPDHTVAVLPIIGAWVAAKAVGEWGRDPDVDPILWRVFFYIALLGTALNLAIAAGAAVLFRRWSDVTAPLGATVAAPVWLIAAVAFVGPFTLAGVLPLWRFGRDLVRLASKTYVPPPSIAKAETQVPHSNRALPVSGAAAVPAAADRPAAVGPVTERVPEQTRELAARAKAQRLPP